MKQRMGKIVALLAASALAMGMMAGCGSSGTSTTAAASTTASAKTTKENATEESISAAGTEKASSNGKVTIEFFNQKTEIVDILNNLIKEYETKNPDVTIKLTTPANASTVLSSRMASNDTPDIFTNWPSSTLFTEVDSGYVQDLSKTGIMDNVQDVARNQWKYKNGEYAATISYNCSGIWYNKDLFDKVGIKETPKTWDELITDCKLLQKAGITPFVTSAKETSITDRQLQVFLASSMGNNYKTFEKDAGAAQIDSSKTYAASLNKMAEKMVQIVDYSQKDTMGTDQDSATADFANGKGAMMIGGSWLLASISSANHSMNISMMPIPGDTVAETNTCAYPGDMSLCIAANSKVKTEAINFVKWMTTTEIAKKYAQAEGNPSCIKGVDYVAPQFKDLYSNYVTSGKFILNPDCNWSASQQDAVGAAIQQLYYDKNTSKFADNLVSAFNDNK